MGPGVIRIVAKNPSPLTFKGTNTYLVGSTSLAVIDPGPDNAEHREAILKAAGGRPITHIISTHAHRDHVDGIAKLKAEDRRRSSPHSRAISKRHIALENSPSGKLLRRLRLPARHGAHVAATRSRAPIGR